VPIGERAIAWLEKYVREARPQLAVQIDTHVSIRTLQQVHAATHPAAWLGHRQEQRQAAARPVSDPVAAEELFAALDKEAAEESQG